MVSQHMQFVLDGRDNLTRVFDHAGEGSDQLARKLLKLGAVGAAPMGAAVLAGTGMMVAGFASAGAGAVAFKAAVQPQLAEVTKASDLYTKAQEAQAEGGEKAAAASKAYKDALDKLPPATRDTATAFIGLKDDYAKWSDSLSDDTMPVFTKGIEMARKALPYLSPLVKTTGYALTEFMDDLDGDGLKSFVSRLDGAAKKTLPDLLNTGRNVFVGIGGIISAFLPTSDKFTGGLEKGSEAFAKWGQGLEDSDGFQRFMDIASTGSDSLGNLALAALDLYEALRPVAGVAIDAAEGAAKFIRWLPPDVLAMIAGGLLGIKLAALGIGAAVSLMSLTPAALGVGAVLLLAGAFVTAWQRSQRFREIASSAMAVVGQVVIGQTRVMLYGFKYFSEAAIAGMQGVIEAAAGMFGSLPGIGPKLKAAAEAARGFKDDTGAYFDEAIGKVDAYGREIDRMPTVIRLKGDITNLDDRIKAAQVKVDGLKQKRKTAVGADKGRLDDAITKAQSKVDGLKQKRAVTVAALDRASGKIATVRWNLSLLRDKSVTITTWYQYKGKSIAAQSAGRMATGGPIGFPGGGPISGPGTGTSDSIPIMASNGEFMINARSTAKYRSLVEAINADTLGTTAFGGGAGGAGANVAKGLAKGMADSSGDVEVAARNLASMVTLGIRGELEIASPSKKAKALMADLGKGLIIGMTGSKDKIKATSKDLAKDIWSAFSGTKDNRTVDWLNRQTSTQLMLAGKRDALAATIKRAKDFAESTRVKAKGDASLGGMFGGEEEVTAGGIKGQLASRLEKMKRFSSYISQLAKRGLNKTMLREILEMGPEQGYAYASALAGADKATFGQINSTQYAINSQAEKLGRAGADALYDSGKNSTKGFLKGLESEKAAIEKTMVKIAKHMQQALRNALGINSPAVEMEPDGVNTARGIGVGVLKGIPYVEAAMDTVAARMTGRVGGTRPVVGRPGIVGRGGGGTVIHIHVDGAVVDKLGVGRAVREALLELKRTNGGGELGLG
ncbi:hypothetical protein ACFY3G_17880 [Streptomyces phaeochromogenes]|uniref:hypothetical protein n=1 Tax=Streptomyces phaeochromogenes TaxID=1923 RepID=UPI0036C76D46